MLTDGDVSEHFFIERKTDPPRPSLTGRVGEGLWGVSVSYGFLKAIVSPPESYAFTL